MTSNSYSNNSSDSNSNEFDLIDFIILLWKGKVKIILAIVFFVILSISYIHFAKEKWSSEAVLTKPSAGQVANFNSILNIVNANNIQDKIALPQLQQQIFDRFSSSIYALSDTLESLSDPQLLKVSQYRNGQDDPLLIKYTGTSAKDAQSKLQNYIKTLNDDVVNDYINDLNKTLSVKKSELENLSKSFVDTATLQKEHRLDVIKNALLVARQSDVNSTKLSQAEYLSDDTLYLLGANALNAMLQNEKTKPIVLSDNYYSVRQSLDALNSLKLNLDGFDSYRFIMKPTLAFKRDSPRQLLIVAISIMMGFIIGSMLVIAEDIYRKRSKIPR